MFASERLKSDPEIVLESVKKYQGALKFASETLRHDVKFLLQVGEINPVELIYAPKEIVIALGINASLHIRQE